MEAYCENPRCENPSFKEVPVSAQGPAGQMRTLCAACDEVYTWGVQHGNMTAVPNHVDELLVDERELATILAALRFHQDENLQSRAGIPDQAIKEIATDRGSLEPLDFKEVGELCERLNVGLKTVVADTDEDQPRERPRVVISVSGGTADVLSKSEGVYVTILDYDVEGVGRGRISKDPGGRPCGKSEWPSSEKVIGNAP